MNNEPEKIFLCVGEAENSHDTNDFNYFHKPQVYWTIDKKWSNDIEFINKSKIEELIQEMEYKIKTRKERTPSMGNTEYTDGVTDTLGLIISQLKKSIK